MAGVGDGQRAVGIDAGAEAGGEAGRRIEFRNGSGRGHRAEQDVIQVIEHGGRIVRKLVAQGAHQGAGIHGRLQALAADVADHDEQRVVFEREGPGRSRRRRR